MRSHDVINPCTAWLAWKLWQSCDVTMAPSVQPAVVYFFCSARTFSTNFGQIQISPQKKNSSKTTRTSTENYFSKLRWIDYSAYTLPISVAVCLECIKLETQMSGEQEIHFSSERLKTCDFFIVDWLLAGDRLRRVGWDDILLRTWDHTGESASDEVSNTNWNL